MKKRIVLLIIVSIVVLKSLKDTNILYNDYQKDYIFVYDKIVKSYSFVLPKNEQNFIENRNIYLNMIKNCKNEEEFVKNINKFLYSLNSIHTRVYNKKDSYAIYSIYKDVSDENPDYKNKFDYIINEFEKKEVISKYYEVKNNINKIDSPYSFNTNKNNFTYFPIIQDRIGYISIENLFHHNIEIDRYKVKKCLDKFKNYKILIIDLRNNSGGDSSYFSNMFLPMIVKENIKNEYYSLITDITQATSNISEIYKINDNDELKILIKRRFDKYSKYIIDKYKYYYKITTEVKKNKNSIEYEGKIYLLINENTASSAAYFAAFVKDSNIGVLLGTPTKSESIGDDPAMYILPKSKLIMRVNDELIISEKLDFKKNGLITNGSVSPDIYINSDYKEKINENNFKYDSYISLILKMENEHI